MIYFLRSGVRGVRRAALRACTVMAEHAPILTAYEFATKEGEARHSVEPAALYQADCRGPQAPHTAAPPCVGSAPARVCHHSCLRWLSGPRGKLMPGDLSIITFLSLASTKLLCSANVNWAMPKRKTRKKATPACRHPRPAGAPDYQDGVRRQPPDAGRLHHAPAHAAGRPGGAGERPCLPWPCGHAGVYPMGEAASPERAGQCSYTKLTT